MIENLINRFINYKEKSDFSIKDKIFLFRELSYLLEWWVNIVDAVKTIWDTSPNYAVKMICAKIYENLKTGDSFSRSLMRCYQYFDEWDVNIIRSWEGSGELINVLRFLANEYEFLRTIKGKYTSAMIYPVLLVTLSVVAVLFLFLKVMPQIFDLVANFDADIPWTTQMMMNLTNFLSGNIQSLIIIFILIVISGAIFVSTDYGKSSLYQFLFGLPWFGRLIKEYHLIRFFRYMRLLIQSGMNYVDVLWFLKNIMNVPMYKSMINDLVSGIKKWESINQNMLFYPNVIPYDAILLFKVGEQTANIPSAVDNIINLYQEDLEKWLNDISKVIEPILIVFVGMIILLIAVSVFGVIGSIIDGATVAT